jgi:hypothetical protein
MHRRLFTYVAAAAVTTAVLAVAISSIASRSSDGDTPQAAVVGAVDGSANGGALWARMTARLRAASGSRKAGEADLARRYALLRGRPERMPSTFRRRMLSALGAPPNALAIDRSQLVRTRDATLWVASGHGIACVFQAPQGALSCTAITEAAKKGIFLGVGGRPTGPKLRVQHFTVMGIVPDGVKAVRLQIGRRTRRRVTVRDNAFAIKARDLIKVRRLER